jgi:hypothetical protein
VFQTLADAQAFRACLNCSDATIVGTQIVSKDIFGAVFAARTDALEAARRDGRITAEEFGREYERAERLLTYDRAQAARRDAIPFYVICAALVAWMLWSGLTGPNRGPVECFTHDENGSDQLTPAFMDARRIPDLSPRDAHARSKPE